MWPWASPAPSSTWLACRTPECIIAVNKNESAPIFDVASLRHRGRPLQGHPHAHRGHPRPPRPRSKRHTVITNARRPSPEGLRFLHSGEGFHGGAERKTDSHRWVCWASPPRPFWCLVSRGRPGDRSLPPGLDLVLLLLPVVLLRCRAELRRVTARDWSCAGPAAFCLHSTSSTWFESLKRTSVAPPRCW